MKNLILLLMSVLLAMSIYNMGWENTEVKTASISSFSGDDYVQKDERTKIKKEELPQTARNVLASDAFKGWTISEVYKTKTGEYEVEMKNGSKSQTIKFDKDGKAK